MKNYKKILVMMLCCMTMMNFMPTFAFAETEEANCDIESVEQMDVAEEVAEEVIEESVEDGSEPVPEVEVEESMPVQATNDDEDGGSNVNIGGTYADTCTLTVTKTFQGIDAADIPDAFEIKVTAASGYSKSLTVNNADSYTDDMLTYKWVLNDMEPGTYNVKESGTKKTGYKLLSSDGDNTDVTLKAAVITVDSHSSVTNNNKRDYPVAGLFDGHKFIVATNTGRNGYVVWTTDYLTDTQKKAFIEKYIPGAQGDLKHLGQKGSIRWISGGELAQKVYFGNEYVQYQPDKGILHFSDPDVWKMFDAGSYTITPATQGTAAITNVYEEDIEIVYNDIDITVIKKDMATESPLGGAVFTITKADAATGEELDRTGEDGKTGTTIKEAGTYIIEEVEAPASFDLNDVNTYEVKVSDKVSKYFDSKAGKFIEEHTLYFDDEQIDQFQNGVLTVKNSRHIDTAPIFTVKKVWDDNNDEDKLRAEYQVTLFANGEVADIRSAKVTLNPDETEYSWENLPLNDEYGNEIVYTVKETIVPEGYTSSTDKAAAEFDDEGIATIINTHVKEPTPPVTPDEPDDPNHPRTDDTTNMLLCTVMFLASLAGVVVLRRRED
ncbi:MAG: Cna B-type domain-containing protein [Clostridiales bacterium]|nr:Cna B-type domain-containing protein [Candidatus Crickella merdequi]